MTTRTIKRETAEAVRPTGLTSALWKTYHAAKLAAIGVTGTLLVSAEGTELDIDVGRVLGPALTAECLHKALESACIARGELARIDASLVALEREVMDVFDVVKPSPCIRPPETSEAA